MRQEIQALVQITFDAPATLSRKALLEAVRDEINRLADADSGSPLAMTGGRIVELREEAEIYGNR